MGVPRMNNFKLDPSGRLFRALALLCLLSLAACGFHMRGTSRVPFESVYVSGKASISTDLKKSFSSSGIKVMPSEEGAQIHLELLNEKNEKRILSLSGGGKVREYELLYTLSYRTRIATTAEWSPEQRVELRRDFSYDDAKLLAKGFEEARLYDDIQTEAVREVIRRLSATAPNRAP
jgi:LPS-assembly lipoprotein